MCEVHRNIPHKVFKMWPFIYLIYTTLMLIILPEYFDVYYTFLFDIAKSLSEIYLSTFEIMFKIWNSFIDHT